MDERIRLIAKNPVAGARFFHFMVQMFIKHVLGVDTDHPGIFGETAGYYGTVEQQGRLTLHLHLLLWIVNALSPEEIKCKLMDPDSDFQKKVIEYLESVHVGEFLTGKQDEVLAQMQQEKDNETFVDPSQSLPTPPPLPCNVPDCGDNACSACSSLNSWWGYFRKQVDYILAQTNIHKCRSTVDDQGRQQKNRSFKGCLNNIWQRCKARFPRLVVLFSFVDEKGHLHLKKLEPWLNTIAPLMTFLLRCNTDATCLKSGTAIKAAIFYITNYVTKSILKTSVIFDIIRKHCLMNPDILDTDPNRIQKVRALMTKIVNNLSAKMEIGGPLACLYLLGFPDHYCSHRFTSFYWQPYVHEVRSFWDSNIKSTIVPKVVLVRVRERVVGLSPVYDYVYRPPELESVCLYDWISSCKRERVKSSRMNTDGNDQDTEHDDLPMELPTEDGVLSPSQLTCEPDDIPLGLFRFLSNHPLHESHAVRVHAPRFRLLPNFSGATLPRRDAGDREYYCATMLTLFKPWRTGACLKSVDSSWDDAFSTYAFTPRQLRLIDNMHLRYECADSQDDFRTLFRDGAVALPSGVAYHEEVLTDSYDDGLDDLNTESLLLDQESRAVFGERQVRRNEQMRVIRGVLDRVGWSQPLKNPLPPPVFGELASDRSPQEWSLLVRNMRQTILQERESSPDPVQRKESCFDLKDMPSLQVYPASKAYLEKKFHSKRDEKIIERLSHDFSLNDEQDRAFRIIANHMCNPYSEQLKMYIGGMGGTGKSRVLHALLAFLHHRNELHRCVVVAPTGTAAALLQGSTYHYMFGVEEKGDEISAIRLSKVATRLSKVDYVFFDEVSMLSCKDMYIIGNRLCLVKNVLDMPFGAMNMIFAGDFAQLPPPYGGESSALYSHTVGAYPSKYSSQIAALGKALWHQVTTVVILRQNMRIKRQGGEDTRFREALSNMRYKACTADDVAFLRTLVSSEVSGRRSVSQEEFRNVSIILSQNIHKDEINRIGCIRFAAETSQELQHFFSEDSISCLVPAPTNYRTKRRKNRTLLPIDVQRALWDQPASTNSSRIAPKLSLCRGMPVLIRSNIATELCITKGQEAVVHSWESSVGTHGKPMLQTLFVALKNPPSTVNLPGLPTNVVPLVRSSASITCSLPDDSEITVSRSQVEVLPNFAMTDYSSQGKTREFNVCDLSNSRSHQAYYTALSRSSSAKGTVILQGFEPRKITGGCSGALRQEYRELELLDHITTLRYHSKLTDAVYGDRRNTILETFREKMGSDYKPPLLHPSLDWSGNTPFGPISDVPFLWNHNFADREAASSVSVAADHVHTPLADTLKRKRDRSDETHPRAISRSPSPPRCLSFIPIGPSWINNSCAYDVLAAMLFNIWQENPLFWHASFCSLNPQFMAPLSRIMQSQPFSYQLVDRVRDEIRILMFNFNSSSFQPGRYVSALDVAEHLLSTQRSVCVGRLECINGHDSSLAQAGNHLLLHSIFLPCITDETCNSVQDWIGRMWTYSHRLCVQCQNRLVIRYSVSDPPPLLCFEVADRPSLRFDPKIMVPVASSRAEISVEYRLSVVIYYGSAHFTLRYISSSGTVYFHDGLRGHSVVPESSPIAELDLLSCRGRSSSLLVYTKSDSSSAST